MDCCLCDVEGSFVRGISRIEAILTATQATHQSTSIGVSILLDAEMSQRQPGIDCLYRYLALRHNRTGTYSVSCIENGYCDVHLFLHMMCSSCDIQHVSVLSETGRIRLIERPGLLPATQHIRRSETGARRVFVQ